MQYSNQIIRVTSVSLGPFFCVCSVVFTFYGEKLRKASKFAQFSLKAYSQNRVHADEWETEAPDEV